MPGVDRFQRQLPAQQGKVEGGAGRPCALCAVRCSRMAAAEGAQGAEGVAANRLPHCGVGNPILLPPLIKTFAPRYTTYAAQPPPPPPGRAHQPRMDGS